MPLNILRKKTLIPIFPSPPSFFSGDLAFGVGAHSVVLTIMRHLCKTSIQFLMMWPCYRRQTSFHCDVQSLLLKTGEKCNFTKRIIAEAIQCLRGLIIRLTEYISMDLFLQNSLQRQRISGPDYNGSQRNVIRLSGVRVICWAKNASL